MSPAADQRNTQVGHVFCSRGWYYRSFQVVSTALAQDLHAACKYSEGLARVCHYSGNLPRSIAAIRGLSVFAPWSLGDLPVMAPDLQLHPKGRLRAEPRVLVVVAANWRYLARRCTQRSRTTNEG